ncbi:ATP-binding protein [Nonomuraea rosea]|uniref:AlbA family DNA-binding domain-containing protein n=1 Tax=Nonomuraea rosea TaxID=638574 RepID=UPI0031ED8002
MTALLDDLRKQLKHLHRQAGEPSTRSIATRTNRQISHTTVHMVLQCRKLPRREQLDRVVEALGGDVQPFRELWVAIRDAQDPAAASGALQQESTGTPLQAAPHQSAMDFDPVRNDIVLQPLGGIFSPSAGYARLTKSDSTHISYADIAEMVSAGDMEAHDLEFRSQIYDTSERSKRHLATDVAAFANGSGGVILVGIVSDKQGQATAMTDVHFGDESVGRLPSIISSLVSPVPDFRIFPIENPERSRYGVLLIFVSGSSSALHTVKAGQGLLFPKRSGYNIRFLSESEIAAAYRQSP